jgi:two-component system chemotaxis response regulator CheB
MAIRSIVVIGASAGVVKALQSFVAGLTAPLAAPILIVLHIGAHPSELPSLLNSAGATPAKPGEDGEAIQPGLIYVAPPDRHKIVVDNRLRLTRGPKKNWTRPERSRRIGQHPA